MITTVSSGHLRKTFPFAKQAPFLRKPAVVSKYYTGIIPVVLTVNNPLKHGILTRIYTGLVDNLHLTNIINL
jgi:hypothetical protein